jgi:(E)-4-hydroxy-3-methylbut-2-enyl-diphosphate synthase
MNPVFHYRRRKSTEVFIGSIPLGSENPIRIQSMTNTSTLDTEGSIAQSIRIIEAGGEYVRLTAQGVREAENLQNIEAGLHAKGYHTPLIADIHFNPKAAETAAGIVEKVRINPGNFVDPVKTFQTAEYSNEAYCAGLQKIRERFLPFLAACKKNSTAIRIGVNHGSLSDRIMSRHGDTPRGMVESCMEFLRICVAEHFYQVVISIKASHSPVMVQTVRLLIDQMEQENMHFPLHLGVTEAGEGEDGRIKSAVGIGTLLLEGIGDTIRVSLSEDPEAEIPVARSLLEYVEDKKQLPAVTEKFSPSCDPLNPQRRKTVPVGRTGGENVPAVIATQVVADEEAGSAFIPDFIYTGKQLNLPENTRIIMDFSVFSQGENRYPLFSANEKEAWKFCRESVQFIRLSYNDLDEEIITLLKEKAATVIVIESKNNHVYEQKAFIHQLINREVSNPVILRQVYNEPDLDLFRIKSATDCGSFFLDMLADGIWIENQAATISSRQVNECSFGILQAAGRRISKTEYVSCPGCGRTLFDLQTVTKKVKAATSHLKGLKIAVMGCIVNGPGEMADADYGYVGAGKGKVSLYKGKECIIKNIPENEAVEKLIALITSQQKGFISGQTQETVSQMN